MNVLILFGGCSPEYSVSLQSASAVIRHMDKSRYTPVMVGITKTGDWYLFTGEVEEIANDTWCNARSCRPAVLSQSRSVPVLLVSGGRETSKVDVVFPVLHGKNGEDGTVQGLCALAGLPLAGCGTLASALCMDKDRAHKLAACAGVSVPRSFVLERGWDEAAGSRQAWQLAFPLFVKPVKAGSSYGVTKVMEAGGFHSAVRLAFRYDDQVLVEETIPGVEVGCAVMGNAELVTGEIDEIELANGFFNFTEKYNLITSKIHVPARIPAEQSDRLKNTAKILYRALGCRGFARVDLFLTPSGTIVFHEVNTIPGFTAHSRFPRMMQAAGFSLEQIITDAIELAVTI